MRSRKRSQESNQGALSNSIKNSSENQLCFEGDDLSRLLKSIQSRIESTRALDTALPEKFWLKQQFSIGANEVMRVLERMASNPSAESCSPDLKSIRLQAVLLATDCNPRWMTKHLPGLAASRKVPLIFIKDKKQGSLRLGKLVKLKTAIAIGIKARGSDVNQLIDEVIAKQDSR